jgi:hypothetical protein
MGHLNNESADAIDDSLHFHLETLPKPYCERIQQLVQQLRETKEDDVELGYAVRDQISAILVKSSVGIYPVMANCRPDEWDDLPDQPDVAAGRKRICRSCGIVQDHNPVTLRVLKTYE